ncbi:MAG: LysR family transcriptional regulator [Oscillospiraceae bacterium]|nr:LysR family transcriptional regulator [Oscillospiraceae bacterium]MBQ8884411.1 LysR family transcriptional regulator [Oscillospiraceae bacterium]
MEQNLNQYRIFYAVAQAGSISKASEKLYISQPAVSKSISKLEESLDAILLKRSRKGITLTDEGKTLFEQLRIAFAAIEAGEKKIKNLHDLGIGKIRIGVSASLCRFVLVPFLKGFIEENPHVRITIDNQSSAKTMKLLEQGKIDAALVVNQNGNDFGEDFIPISELEDIFVATPTYIENLKTRISTPDADTPTLLESANLMLLDEENISRVFVDNYLNQHGIEVNKFLEVTNMDLLIEFAKIGMGVACIIREMAKRELSEGSVIELPLKFPMNKRTVGFVFPKENLAVPTVSNFRKYVLENKERIVSERK